MNKILAIAICFLLVFCLVVPSLGIATSTPKSSLEIVQYDDSGFILITRSDGEIILSMYKLDASRAKRSWTKEYLTDADFKLYSLPGIDRLVLLYKDSVHTITDTGDEVETFCFDKTSGWHYPVFSSDMAAMALNDISYQDVLVITKQGIKLVHFKAKTGEQIVTKFAHVDGRGTLYYENESGNGYWKVDIDGNCESIKTRGQLAYATDDGLWILQGRKLYLPDGKIVKLPGKKAKHDVSESHPGGAIISDNLVVSNSNKQVKKIKLAFPAEEMYGFSRNLCYFLSEGEFDDQERNRWDAWSFKKGTCKIQRKYEWINPTITIVDPGYIVLDSGNAIFIGENTTKDSWQLWALDIDNEEYSEINIE